WKFATLMVLGPLGVALLNAIIRLSGDGAVVNNQLLAFALSPLGLTTLLLLLTVSVALGCVERAGLYYLLFNALHGRRCSSWVAFRRALWATPRFLGVALVQVGLFLVVLLPFAAAAWLAYALLLSASDINYYLAEQPWEFAVAVVA